MFLLTEARLVTPRGIIERGWLAVHEGEIVGLGAGRPDRHLRGDRTDLGGAWVLPGFIDIHMHGGGGAQITTTDPDEILRAVQFHQHFGTTRTLVSLVSDQLDRMVACIETIVRLVRDEPRARSVVGIHLEGPFLNLDKRGCHHSDFVIPPSIPGIRRLLAAGDGLVKVVTLAPELPGSMALLHEITNAGAVASVGHTHATFEQATAAFDSGARLATHLFNAMPAFHHRALGAAGAALAHDDVVNELISDGIHLDDALVRIAANAAGADRIALVTDATPAAGMRDGRFHLGPVPIFARDGEVTLADGTLAGSTLTMDAALRRTVQWSRVSLERASLAASSTPARVLGIAERTGSLEVGKDADLVVMDASLAVQSVYVRGTPV